MKEDRTVDIKRMIVMASGGAFIGSLTGLLPITIVGTIAGAIFGLLVTDSDP